MDEQWWFGFLCGAISMFCVVALALVLVMAAEALRARSRRRSQEAWNMQRRVRARPSTRRP